MSEKRFQDAKAGLAFSQSLVDKMRQSPNPELQSAPQPPAPAAQPAPAQAQKETAQNENPEMAAMSSFMNEIRGLFKVKEEEEKKTQDLLSEHDQVIEEKLDDLKKEEPAE